MCQHHLYVFCVCMFSCNIILWTVYKWCTVASGTFKYVVPRLTCHHEGAARVMTFQPRDNIFECSTSKHASSVLSYDQLRASTKSQWIIYMYVYVLPQKTSKFPMCNCAVWLLHHHHISTYCWRPFLGFHFRPIFVPFSYFNSSIELWTELSPIFLVFKHLAG